MLYLSPDFLSSLWTSAICADTDAVGVPSGIKQKSAVALGGVARVERSMSDMVSERDFTFFGYGQIVTFACTEPLSLS